MERDQMGLLDFSEEVASGTSQDLAYRPKGRQPDKESFQLEIQVSNAETGAPRSAFSIGTRDALGDSLNRLIHISFSKKRLSYEI